MKKIFLITDRTGGLYCKDILYMFNNIAIVFICENDKGEKFLFSIHSKDSRSYSWLVFPLTDEDIHAASRKDKTLNEIVANKTDGFIIRHNYKSDETTIEKPLHQYNELPAGRVFYY